VPTKLTPRQTEILEQLAKELGEEVQPMQATFFERLRSFFE
jgi:molecular chaperone DnaJ